MYVIYNWKLIDYKGLDKALTIYIMCQVHVIFNN